MIDLAAEKLPGITAAVSYEAMADDPADTRRIVATLCGIDANDRPAATLPDDRGSSAPYREFLAAAR